MADSRFIQVGALRPVDNGWMVTEKFVYHTTLIHRRIEVHVGFFTDLASVPKVVPRFIVDVATGKNRKAAVVHDLLCDPRHKRRLGISQSMSDLIFREALEVCGVPRWRANIMYTAVMAYQLVKHRKDYWRVP